MIDQYNVLNKYAEKYGDGFYLVSESRIVSVFDSFFNSFSSIYPNCIIAYSFKTCYSRPLLRKMLELGAYAEITSEYEYELAKQIGFDDGHMVYNGPYKKMNVVYKIVSNGGIVNIDSKVEAKRICELENIKGSEIGIRCNANIDGRSSRFGIDINSEDMNEVIQMVLDKGMRIKGFMCHIRTKTMEDWNKKAQVLIDFVEAITRKKKLPDIDYVDFGGGYQYQEALFDKYADTIVKHVKRLNNKEINIILEPGAAICEGTMDYYARVVNTNIINQTKYVTIAATISDISAIRKRVPGRVIYICNTDKVHKDRYNKQVIVGFTCLEDDIILDDAEIDAEEGDFIVFENVGAYAGSLRPVFIRGCPAVLYENEKGEISVDSYADNEGCMMRKNENI